MNDESEILAKLDRLAELQVEGQAIMKESQAIQRQAFELQQKAVENQMLAVRNQFAMVRIYRIFMFIFAVLIAIAVSLFLWNFSRKHRDQDDSLPPSENPTSSLRGGEN